MSKTPNSNDSYERGVRDGRENSTAGSPTKDFFSELIEGYTEKEIEEIKDYNQGYEHGRRQR